MTAAPAYTETTTYRRRWWTLAVLSVSLVIIGLDNTILNIALPTLQREFNASASSLQWMVDAYILVFAGLLLTMGATGDRYGRRLALQAGLVIFGLASLFAAYAQSAEQLIAARAVMGIGGALIMPSTLSVIVDVFPREERGKAIGIWAGMAAVGIAVGPVLGGWLLERFWWGSVFFINVPIVLAALVAGMFLVPESRDPEATRLDLPGAALSMGALATLIYAIIEAPARGWLDPFVIAAFAVAFLLSAAFILWELRTATPMLDMRLFTRRRFSTGSAAIALAFLALFGTLFLLTQYLQFVRGYSAFDAGLRLTPLALGMMAGAANSHRLVARFGSKLVIAGGLTVIALTLVALSFLSADTPYWVIATGLVFLALGMANTMAPATDAVMGAVPEAKAGVGSAMNDTTRQVGGALGVALLGSLVNAAYSSTMADPASALPPAAGDAARNSVGAAIQVAAQVGGPAGDALRTAAAGAFVDALGAALLVAAAVSFAGALLVLRFMPARDPAMPIDTTTEDRSAAGALQWGAEGREAPSAR
ncbi:MAG: DHA2 family efflux MFS transporter permease subunit [Dehalococcoidia bacterium]